MQPSFLRDGRVGAVGARLATISRDQGLSMVWQAKEVEGPLLPEESEEGVRNLPAA